MVVSPGGVAARILDSPKSQRTAIGLSGPTLINTFACDYEKDLSQITSQNMGLGSIIYLFHVSVADFLFMQVCKATGGVQSLRRVHVREPRV